MFAGKDEVFVSLRSTHTRDAVNEKLFAISVARPFLQFDLHWCYLSWLGTSAHMYSLQLKTHELDIG